MDNIMHHLLLSSHRAPHTLRTHEAPTYRHAGPAEPLACASPVVYTTPLPPLGFNVGDFLFLLCVVVRRSVPAMVHSHMPLADSVPILNVEVERGHG